MSHAFGNLAFTPAVKAAQQRDGSRASYERRYESPVETFNDRMGEAEMGFVRAQRSFFLATVSETGWPYVQHRGGPVGFLKVLDERTLAFADFAGNRQMVSVGNLSVNDRVALILVDYVQGGRLKMLGRLAVHDLHQGDAMFQQLVSPDYRARPQRAFVITVDAIDWNCGQHIPQRIDAEDVQRALAERDARIAALEAQVGRQG